MKPLVSICCISYNHEKFIRDCIEGFLMQETNFAVEILIFDDASTDDTQKIIKEYAARNVNIITFLQTENQWQYKKYGLIDWLFPSAKGKYIALCEGDDYWTDPLKLQKQVDFLEINPDYAFSMGIVNTLIEKNGEIIRSKEHVNPSKSEVYQLKDYIKAPFSQTSSFMFRNKVINFPTWTNKIHAGDQLLVILNTGVSGKIKYHNEVFSIYRLNSKSITYNSNIKELKEKGDFFLQKIDELTGYSFKKIIFMRKILHRIYFLTFSKSYFVKYTSNLLFYVLTKLSYRI